MGMGAEVLAALLTKLLCTHVLPYWFLTFSHTLFTGFVVSGMMIEVSQIKKSFGDQVVLNSVSFSVKEGESVAIIGRSGTGKSVLIKHLVGLLSPDEGSVRVDGQDLVGMTERQLLSVRQKFGMLFQSAALFDSMSVHDNIAFPFGAGCRPKLRRSIDAWKRCWDWWNYPESAGRCPRNCLVVCRNESVWLGPLCIGHRLSI